MPDHAVPSRPNIVFVLADDLGWRDLGCYGSTFYETPRLDQLAAEGAFFTDAYAAAPVCSPTRASLLTGKYPARVGVTNFLGSHQVGRLADVPAFPYLPQNEVSLARSLRDGGYRTWHVGKWHLGDYRYGPERHGFDVNVAGSEWGAPKQGFFSPYGMPNLDDGPDGEYLTDRLTDEAIGLISAGGDQPFFLHLSHYAVHTPIQAPEPLVAKYVEKAARLGLDDVDPIVEGEPYPTWHKRHRRVQRRTVQSDPVYAAMVENLDWNIGQVIDALDDAGLADNTIVIVYSDNGGLATAEGSPTCNAPLAEGKGWMYDGGVREPLLIRWPGPVAAGVKIDVPVTTPDLYPTLLEAAGLPPRPSQHVDGVSFLPALRGEPFERGPIYWHYPHYGNQGGTPGAAVRDGDWKLIRFFEDERCELYNLADDIEEKRDLSSIEPAVVKRLFDTLITWMDDVHAQVPGPNPLTPFDDLPG